MIKILLLLLLACNMFVFANTESEELLEFKINCKNGAMSACEELAWAYRDGEGEELYDIEIDFNKAEIYFKKLCNDTFIYDEPDHDNGCNSLGSFYEFDIQKSNYLKASKSYLRGCSKTNDTSCCKSVARLKDTVSLINDIQKHSLFDYAKSGDIKMVKSLLSNDAKVNQQNKKGWTALMKATYYGYVDIVKLLLDKGARLDISTKKDNTALDFALREDRVDVLKLFLKQGIKIEHRDKNENTPLMVAADYNSTKIIQYLLAKGAKVNQQNKKGWTALMKATYYGYVDIVKLLLDKGADINIFLYKNAIIGRWDNSYYTDIFTLMLNRELSDGHINIIKLLVKYGADINVKHDRYIGAMSFLRIILRSTNDPKVVKALLDLGAIVDADDLYYAMSSLADDEVHHKWSVNLHKKLDAMSKVFQLPGEEDESAKKDEVWALGYKRHNSVAILKLLEKYGVDLKIAKVNSWANVDTLQYLKKKGVQVDTSIDYILKDISAEKLQLLVDMGGDLASTYKINKKTNKIKIFTLGQIFENTDPLPLIKICVKQDVDFNNFKLYQEAVKTLTKPKETLDFLFTHGLNPNLQNEKGETVLASILGTVGAKERMNAIKYLITKTDLNIVDNTGKTVLLKVYNPELFKLLLESGADPYVKNKDGISQLQLINKRLKGSADTLPPVLLEMRNILRKYLKKHKR